MKILAMVVIFATINGYASTSGKMTIELTGLIPQTISRSTMHAFVFLRQKENGNLGAEMIDLICQDGDIRLRIRTQFRLREFRSHGDFYCYSALAFAQAVEKKFSTEVNFDSVVTVIGDKAKMSSAIFKFSDGSILDLYRVNGTTLGRAPLFEVE